MADNIEITINGKEKFTGRLIGLVDPRECKAVLTVDDAARKVYTAESMSIKDIPLTHNKRFVVATDNYSSEGCREVFISPVIRYLSFLKGSTIFKCDDNNEYVVRTI